MPTLCLWLIAGLAAGTARVDGGAPNIAYVADGGAGGGALVAIDIGQRRVAGSIPVGGALASLVLSPDSRYAFVVQTDRDAVAVVDTYAPRVVGHIAVGRAPRAVATDLSQSAPMLYVSNSGDNTLSVINETSRRVVATIAVGTQPQGLAVAGPGSGIAEASDSEVYVANATSGTVSVVSARRRVVLATIPVPGGPTAVVVPSLGGLAYVATAAGTVVSISLLSHSVVGTVLRVPGAALGTMDYDAVTGQVYVPDAGHNVLHVVSPGGGGTRTLPLGGAPVAVAITFEGSFGFVAERNAGRVVMFDAATRQLLATLLVGGAPQAIVTGAYPVGSPAQPPLQLIGGIAVLVAALAIGAGVTLRRRRRPQEASSTS